MIFQAALDLLCVCTVLCVHAARVMEGAAAGMRWSLAAPAGERAYGACILAVACIRELGLLEAHLATITAPRCAPGRLGRAVSRTSHVAARV